MSIIPEDFLLREHIERQEAIAKNLDETTAKLNFPCGLPTSTGTSYLLTDNKLLKGIIQKFQEFAETEGIEVPKVENDPDWESVNDWHLKKPYKGKYGWVQIRRHTTTGKVSFRILNAKPYPYAADLTLNSLFYLSLFGLESAELAARERLMESLSDIQKRDYILADSFFQKGKSGIQYLLRKNRPTIACRVDKDAPWNAIPVCALCTHPLAYYANTFTGVLAPSDEVYTHLRMIRTSEDYYWRKCNKHKLDTPQAGIG